MNNEQILQKALEVYPPEYEQEDFDETWDMNKQYREPYIKALKEIESLPKIKVWVARDLGNEIELNLFTEKPTRGEFNWFVSNGDIIKLNRNIFPELKWESEPIEVELIIRKL